MVLDIIVCLVAVAFAAWGLRTGFLNGLLSFVSTFVAIVLSVLIARPLAGLFNGWFGWADSMAYWFSGDGLDGVVRNHGMLLLTVFIGIFFFILIMVGVFFLKRFIQRLRNKSRAFNRIDSIGGIFIGLVRFVLICVVLSSAILIFDSLFGGVANWIFGGSTVAFWVYQRCIDILWPFLAIINAAIFG